MAIRVLHSLFLSVLFTSLSFGQAYSPWGVTDTLTSGDFDDLNPVLDHGGMEGQAIIGNLQYQWLVFDRSDSFGSSVVAKRFSNRNLTWETDEYVLVSHMPGGVLHYPDVATLNDTSSLAVWQQELNGSRKIMFSRWDGSNWSQPDILSADTSDDSTPRVRLLKSAAVPTAASPFVVGWKNGRTIRYAMIGPDGVDSVSTAVSSHNDSLEFDMGESGLLFYLVWTDRDSSGVTRLCLAGMNPNASAPAFRALDTLDFPGSVINPHIVAFSTFAVFFDSRIDGHLQFYSTAVSLPNDTTLNPATGYINDDPASDNLNAQGWGGQVLVESLRESVQQDRLFVTLPGFFVYESRTSRDSSLIFSSVSSTDTMSAPGHNYSPAIGSFSVYHSRSQIGLAAWVSNRQGRSHIYSRMFWIVPDAVVESPRPTDFFLNQNYPNPFNPTTNIPFGVRSSALVVLKVYDVLGREVKRLVNEVKTTGRYEVQLNASGLPSGVYFYRLEAGSFTETKKCLLLK